MKRHFYTFIVHIFFLVLAGRPDALEARQVDLDDAEIGSGLRIEEMRFEFGYLKGRLCNETGRILNEVSFYFEAYDRSGGPLWNQTVDLWGINHDECRKFEVKEKFDGYRKVENWRAIPVFFNRTVSGRHDNPNDDVYIESYEIDQRELSGRLCSNRDRDRDNVFLNAFGPGFDEKIDIRARGFVGVLPARSCVDFSLYVDSRTPVDVRQEVLFGIYEIPARGPNGSGRIVQGLAYENLYYRRGYLNANLYNRSPSLQENFFIKFYGMSAENAIILEKSYFIEKLAPGARFDIKDRLYEHENVGGWRFSLVGWNAGH